MTATTITLSTERAQPAPALDQLYSIAKQLLESKKHNDLVALLKIHNAVKSSTRDSTCAQLQSALDTLQYPSEPELTLDLVYQAQLEERACGAKNCQQPLFTQHIVSEILRNDYVHAARVLFKTSGGYDGLTHAMHIVAQFEAQALMTELITSRLAELSKLLRTHITRETYASLLETKQYSAANFVFKSVIQHHPKLPSDLAQLSILLPLVLQQNISSQELLSILQNYMERVGMNAARLQSVLEHECQDVEALHEHRPLLQSYQRVLEHEEQKVFATLSKLQTSETLLQLFSSEASNQIETPALCSLLDSADSRSNAKLKSSTPKL